MMFSVDRIADIQGFNKVYQNLLKQINFAILETGYTLTEKDVLLQISKSERCAANILIQQLNIDRSYMSRMLAKFEKFGDGIRSSIIVSIQRFLTKQKSLNLANMQGVLRLCGGKSADVL